MKTLFEGKVEWYEPFRFAIGPNGSISYSSRPIAGSSGSRVRPVNEEIIWKAGRAKELGLPVQVPAPEYPAPDYTVEELLAIKQDIFDTAEWALTDHGGLDLRVTVDAGKFKLLRERTAIVGGYTDQEPYEYQKKFWYVEHPEGGVFEYEMDLSSSYHGGGCGSACWIHTLQEGGGRGKIAVIRSLVMAADPTLVERLDREAIADKEASEKESAAAAQKRRIEETEELKKHFGL